jgi:hypothetical protein
VTSFQVVPSLERLRQEWRSDLLTESKPVPVPRQSWLKYYPSEAEDLFSREFFAKNSISISALESLAVSGASNKVLFVATMMWGRGPKNGRLMPKFRKVSQDANFEATLEKTRGLITVGKPVDAYQAWIDSGIKGIREPFFTKWLFVCGLDSKATGLQPLVLDSRVWKSLSAIGWSSERQTGTKYRKNPAGAYGAYLEAMKFWASEMSSEAVTISPLQVEQFFFRKNGNLPS